MADFVVTSAKILSESKKREIIIKLNVSPDEVSFRVDEALIGGIVISDGERVLDASVKHRVRAAAENVQVALANKPLEHILSSLKEEFSRSAEKPEKVQAGIVRSVQDGVIFVDG
ncbi:MAG TPA: hypothetical protein DIC18_02935, partial [Clostridiales bacterium]|nr:hypothetical protein [Clostridiales bacterium]